MDISKATPLPVHGDSNEQLGLRSIWCIGSLLSLVLGRPWLLKVVY